MSPDNLMMKIGPINLADDPYSSPTQPGGESAIRESKTAADFLAKAAKLQAERGKQYDSPGGERSMGKCVSAFNLITGKDLSEAEGWLLLQILKDVRQWATPNYHADSAEDCVSYAALKAEALARES